MAKVTKPIWSKFRKPKKPILLVGPGGTGKTTLRKVLGGDYDTFPEYPGEYDETTGVESQSLKADSGVDILDTPGQDDRRKVAYPALLKQLSRGDFQGIVIVNSYGYHSMGDVSMTRSKHHIEGDSTNSFLIRYTAERRKVELNILKEISEAVESCHSPLWILSFIGKQDLWYGVSDDVIDYYSKDGAYAKAFQKFKKNKSEQHLWCEIVFGALTIGNLVAGPRKDIIATNSPTYGREQQVKSIVKLKDTLQAQIKWKKN